MPGAEGDRLGGRGHRGAGEEVVEHLHRLALAGAAADPEHVAGHGLEDRPKPVERRLRAEYMIESVAFTAPLTPPEIGASTYSMPCPANSSCTRRAAAVPIVE